MKNAKEKVVEIILCMFELIVGVLLLIEPEKFTYGIIKVIGIVLIFFGLIEIVKYFRTNIEEVFYKQMIVKGLIFILAGIICAIKTEQFILTFPVLTAIYGFIILLVGFGKIQMSVDMFRFKNSNWYWAIMNAAISIICAIVILKKSFTSTKILWIFTGGTFIVMSVIDIITFFVERKSEEELAD